ncbi:hypothetical protein [Curtobacterium sp. PhB136]|uniref:hypothetical protein n=1 Tax=Curtobacterium sp. PhB136 TaxID=2485181 RepID=UPI001049C7E5|nr:hypothetical protein [Curtobacterium sp. PhB136]
MLEDLLKDPLVRAFVLPIVLAIVTTFAVEYLAKPALEARKARLLRGRQQFDEVIYGFQKLVLLMSSMIDDATARQSPELGAVQRQQAADASQASQELFAAVSQLPSGWVAKHRVHMRRTALYVSYVRGLLIAGSGTEVPSMDHARSLGEGISNFDAYFLTFATLRDSQPPLIKRAFSKVFMRGDYERAALMALKHASLNDPVADAAVPSTSDS